MKHTSGSEKRRRVSTMPPTSFLPASPRFSSVERERFSAAATSNRHGQPGVATPGCPCLFEVAAAEKRSRSTDEKRGDAGRNEVGGIVETRRRFSEPLVCFIAVTDHGIERVRRLVCHRQWDAAEREIEQRRD